MNHKFFYFSSFTISNNKTMDLFKYDAKLNYITKSDGSVFLEISKLNRFSNQTTEEREKKTCF